jgi:hypothetical protein
MAETRKGTRTWREEGKGQVGQLQEDDGRMAVEAEAEMWARSRSSRRGVWDLDAVQPLRKATRGEVAERRGHGLVGKCATWRESLGRRTESMSSMSWIINS